MYTFKKACIFLFNLNTIGVQEMKKTNKGRTWCISFEDSAKKDGDVQVKYKVTDAAGNPREIKGVWEGYKVGDTPNDKAMRFFKALKSPPYSDLVAVTRAGNTVCFQLKDNAPYQDINGVEVGDQTGQNFNIYDGPSPTEPTVSLEVVQFRIEGIPVSPNGEVRLGLGRVHPLTRVPTHVDGEPLPVPTILENLVESFNTVYEGLEFSASLEGDEVIIPKVPCDLGVRAGSDDLGLNYWISMTDPHAGPFRRVFDKADILVDANRLTNARLDFAGIPQVRFADPELNSFVLVDDGAVGMVAAKKWAFTVVNTTNQNANDVHITLAGTGGSLSKPKIVFEPKGCKGRASASGNRVDVVWDTPCVRPGDTVAILVCTDFVPLDVVSVLWTLDGRPIPGQDGQGPGDGSGKGKCPCEGSGTSGDGSGPPGTGDRTVLALPGDDCAPVGDPKKPGPNGWPTDPNGNEVIPPFSHADQFFIECWTPQPNRTIGVKGSLCGLFRWDCDLLASHIQQLTAAIQGVWGVNSIPNFRAGNNPGQPALPRPNYPQGFDNGGNLNPFRRVQQFPQAGTGRVVITIGNCDKYFDERGGNYMLMWLEQRFSACCL